MFKKDKTQTNFPHAEVSNDHLVISLLGANDPKVWRSSLDKIGSAAFELKKVANSEDVKLILKPKKGAAEIIATLPTQDMAMAALSAASSALQNNCLKPAVTKSSRQVKQDGHQDTASRQSGSKWTVAFLRLFLGLFIVIGLYMYLSSLIPEQNIGFKTTASSNSALNVTPQDATGVPVSADDFLNGL